uniref:Bifunctional inhibitor/plant lipid transfer protein/seed storage helical domain-containing protein n=1 Tax=Aegilops tauschii subsp. strangulata TaxID=200361 RepID=A0A453M1P3_AEGTS
SASAQSGCTAALVGLYPCMNYISGNDTAPTKSCCSQLGSVVQSQPQCLCSALGGDSSSLGGMTINKTRALELPNACSVQTPPASKCNGGKRSTAYLLLLLPGLLTKDLSFLLAAGGGSAPGAGSGSKTTPTAYLQGSGGSSLHGTARLVLALSAAAIFVVSTV